MTTAEGPISSPTDELTGKLNRTKDIEKWLKKIDLLLDAARRCSIEVDNANYKSAYKKFCDYQLSAPNIYFINKSR